MCEFMCVYLEFFFVELCMWVRLHAHVFAFVCVFVYLEVCVCVCVCVFLHVNTLNRRAYGAPPPTSLLFTAGPR